MRRLIGFLCLVLVSCVTDTTIISEPNDGFVSSGQDVEGRVGRLVVVNGYYRQLPDPESKVETRLKSFVQIETNDGTKFSLEPYLSRPGRRSAMEIQTFTGKRVLVKGVLRQSPSSGSMCICDVIEVEMDPVEKYPVISEPLKDPKSLNGKYVAVVGNLTGTKSVQIHGVDVCQNRTLLGQQVVAKGILRVNSAASRVDLIDSTTGICAEAFPNGDPIR